MTDASNGRLLIVDDAPNAARVLSAIFSASGYDARTVWSAEDAVAALEREDMDAVITDIKMPGKDGIQLFEHISEHHPEIPVIFLTAYGTLESAVHTLSKGAFYYFTKPPDYSKLKAIIARAVEQRRLKLQLDHLRSRLSEGEVQKSIIGSTPAIIRILETVNAIKDSQSTVVLTGETGTGKELVARTLHEGSRRGGEPFVAVNCAAIPRDLLESELFGYEKGAFTGASAGRVGKFEAAGKGTVLLDEIGELDLSLQSKLLRALQEKEIERLGGNRRIKVDFRLVCSTNLDLRREVRGGRFREDLFYRINVVEMRLPSLGERKDDIPLLAAEFLKEFCAREDKVLTLSQEVLRIFMDYSWPGNIRQLRNIIERAVVLARGSTITRKELPKDLSPRKKAVSTGGKTLREIEIQAVLDTIELCNGNKARAARELGMSRKALYKCLKDSSVSL
ncbi:sigma-54-dependent transcriptional regulator [Candidatus Moduliflexota bacterium]